MPTQNDLRANMQTFDAINAALEAANARLAAADELDPDEDELGLIDEPEINAALDAITDIQAGEDASFEEASAQLQATQNVPGVIVWEGFGSLGVGIEPIDEDDLLDTEEV